MARAGEELHNPVTGQRLIFRRITPELVEVESVYRPGAPDAPEHYHPHQEERFEVLSGRVRVGLPAGPRELGPGDRLTIPPGTPHTFGGLEEEDARLNWQTLPALKTAAFFETVWGLAEDGKVNSKGMPNPLQLAVIAREYDQEFRLTKPPRAIQRLLFTPLAALGRLAGYKGHYRRGGQQD
jgi:quercetin dioxygenase-like cupin family protein